MRLISVELKDFRGFYGVQRVEFASGDEKRVTIFHGENGAGKTNLLNAIHWCLAGKFTPRFQEYYSLINREAVRQGSTSCYVELVFRDEPENGGREYRVRRVGANNGVSKAAEVYEIDGGSSKPIEYGEALIAKFIPQKLIEWFFFDAEAIGALELSGTDRFKADLRKTLGFELVDTVLKDLDALLTKKHKEVATQSKDKKLQDIVNQIERIDHILPGQLEQLDVAEQDHANLDAQYENTLGKLLELPKAEPYKREQRDIEFRIRRAQQVVAEAHVKAAKLIGRAAPELLLRKLAVALEDRLQEDEDRCKLPAPYSDQLVKDIEEGGVCICGRPVEPGSEEAHRIHGLLQFANTSVLNQRIRGIRYLVRDIERGATEFPEQIAGVRSELLRLDQEIGSLEQRHEELTEILKDINDSEVQRLESVLKRLQAERDAVGVRVTQLRLKIDENKRTRKDLELQRANAERMQVVSEKLRKEIGKIERLRNFIARSLEQQEHQALLILSQELNLVLHKYLTKHYSAKINPNNYAVQLVDQNGKTVGHSTGEGQVLKFAFIATVVALAARKTQQKVHWMAEPTIAPLVLDAPFSALDPEYQGSVARNLAKQSTQLVLMLSSAAWGEKVSEALHDAVGKRYLIVSHEAGPRGDKPVKTLSINGTTHTLNRYDAERTESTIVEIAA